ncbi:glycoside hydrolase family 3 C-terminal domain-containing protein [Christensenella timonensis]|uniref:glycoside hydrolase family 3 C-terminal domain-containing protein n=1 Tax=Christensenella timonensis TaxID=1816678 RepID=UPI000834EBB9|nr:glycoside hydrolase family 3 C-terminal domain-containing protein [Christensenella timonensis]
MNQIEDILSQLTLEQKADLCSGLNAWNTFPIASLGVPEALMTDGPHGLRKQYDKESAMLESSVPATCFPPAATTACSWDKDLLYRVGEALGSEARDQGVSLVLGPGINIKRSPLCGRNFEYFSEDPILSGDLGAQMIKGIQSTGTGACIKHFAANNREYFRMVSNSIVDERALHEIYLQGFERAIKTARPYAVMSAYNMLNGDYCGEKKELIAGILREDWGFDGLVVSDWGACYNREKGIAAGMDLEMPYSGEENTERIMRSVAKGTLDQQALDACVRRVLSFVFRCEAEKSKPYTYDAQKNHEIAREAAASSAVLLKNENGLLPLKPGTKVALLGEFAEKPRYQGAGSSMINPLQLETALEEFPKYGIHFIYSKGYDSTKDETDESLLTDAKRVADEADVAVIFAGLPAHYEMEGIDRTHICIPQNQAELIEQVAATKPVVVLLCGGAPVEMPWIGCVTSLLHCYLGGEASASAAAQLLTGAVNPSGKLAETYPIHLSDTPSYRFFSDDRHNVEYRESIYVGYRYYDAAKMDVLFPFGYGLSYTTFSYSDLRLSRDTLLAGQSLSLSFTVTNTGKVAGAEAAQVYIEHGPAEKHLCAFGKVFLQPGETKELSFTLSERDFSFYHGGWKLMDDCTVLVGASSRDIRLKAMVSIPRGMTPPKYPLATDGHWDAVAFYSLFDKIPQISFSKHPFTINATLTDFDSAAIGRQIHRVAKWFAKKYIVSDNYLGQQIMLQLLDQNPFRVLVSLSGGLLTYCMARGVLMIANGQVLIGLLAFITASRKRRKRKIKSK